MRLVVDGLALLARLRKVPLTVGGVMASERADRSPKNGHSLEDPVAALEVQVCNLCLWVCENVLMQVQAGPGGIAQSVKSELRGALDAVSALQGGLTRYPMRQKLQQLQSISFQQPLFYESQLVL